MQKALHGHCSLHRSKAMWSSPLTPLPMYVMYRRSIPLPNVLVYVSTFAHITNVRILLAIHMST